MLRSPEDLSRTGTARLGGGSRRAAAVRSGFSARARLSIRSDQGVVSRIRLPCQITASLTGGPFFLRSICSDVAAGGFPDVPIEPQRPLTITRQYSALIALQILGLDTTLEKAHTPPEAVGFPILYPLIQASS